VLAAAVCREETIGVAAVIDDNKLEKRQSRSLLRCGVVAKHFIRLI